MPYDIKTCNSYMTHDIKTVTKDIEISLKGQGLTQLIVFS